MQVEGGEVGLGFRYAVGGLFRISGKGISAKERGQFIKLGGFCPGGGRGTNQVSGVRRKIFL